MDMVPFVSKAFFHHVESIKARVSFGKLREMELTQGDGNLVGLTFARQSFYIFSFNNVSGCLLSSEVLDKGHDGKEGTR